MIIYLLVDFVHWIDPSSLIISKSLRFKRFNYESDWMFNWGFHTYLADLVTIIFFR